MKRKWIAGALALALTATTIFAAAPSAVAAAGDGENDHGIGSGTTYYVSSENGSDSNGGKSESQAFQTLDKINEITLQPGDRVLLENGSVFEDQYLHIKGSGTEEAYIEISTYGDESEGRPLINTNGKGVWYQDYGHQLDNKNHKYQGNVSSSILLKDVEYIEVRGLEITNDRTKGIDEADKGLAYNDYRVMDRTGVAGVAQNKGTLEHIVLDDLYIHDVTGNVQNKHMANGGIYFIVQEPADEQTTGIAKYDDLVIENCRLERVNRWGIAAAYTTYHGKFGAAAIPDDLIRKYGATNVVIQNNYIKEAGGDSITTMYCDRPIIQNNVSEDAAAQIKNGVYDAPGMPGGATFGKVAAAIWPWKCKDAVFQYNECFDTLNAFNGNGDGQAWDADYGDGTLYQYNYSHGNTGGTVMFCGVDSINNTFRYNISQNEGMGPLDPAGNTGICHVYNNTFYIKEGLNTIWSTAHANNGPVTMENNIFYFAGDTPRSGINWQPSTNNNKVYDNNLYYNLAENNRPSDSNGIYMSAGEALLADAGNGPTAPAADLTARVHNDPNAATEFDGYKLAENSPAINAGKIITDQNGFEIEHDFFGHKITATPEIGAAESDVPSVGLGSTVYMTDETDEDNKLIYIPFTDKNPTTAGEVIMNVTTDDTAIVSVVDAAGDAIAYTDAIAEGMKLRISDGRDSVNEYTIRQKNEYSWTMDYAGPQQGNVWFGQMKTGEDGAWGNIAGYDSTYPNWQVNTYYGPGVDAPTHETPITEETHGLLSAPPNTDIYTAMAFRAPKTGTVSFAVKDGEPYLRQDGNSGGTVTLSLLVNDVEKQSVTLETSKVQAEDWADFDPIEVTAGDYIRVAAKTNGGASKPSLHVSPVITYLDVQVKDTTAPGAPGNVTVSGITEDSVAVSWEEAADNVAVAGYNIYLDGSETPVNGEQLVTELTYTLTGLDAATAYTVKVEAVDTSGNKSETMAEAVFTTLEAQEPEEPDKEAPTKPADVKVDAKTEDSITISWTASTDNVGVKGYKILVDGMEKANVTEGTTCTITGLEPGTEYEIVVIAYDAMGSQAASDVLTVSTLPESGEEPGEDPGEDPGKDPGEDPDKDPGAKPDDKPAKDPAKEEDKAVQTGDAADFSVWAAALLVSAGAVVAVRMRKKES